LKPFFYRKKGFKLPKNALEETWGRCPHTPTSFLKKAWQKLLWAATPQVIVFSLG
jgi:hypothetical protein